jgi:hypothetical protein
MKMSLWACHSQPIQRLTVPTKKCQMHLTSQQKRRNVAPVVRYQIGKYAAQNGNRSAVNKFTKELGKPLSESTVRGMKKNYLDKVKKAGDPSKVTELVHGNRGQPLHQRVVGSNPGQGTAWYL